MKKINDEVSVCTHVFNTENCVTTTPIENHINLNFESKNQELDFSCIMPTFIEFIPEWMDNYNGFNIIIHNTPNESRKQPDGTYHIKGIELRFAGIKMFNQTPIFEFNYDKEILGDIK